VAIRGDCGKLFEAVRSSPQALKRKHIFNSLAARLEVVPFPFPVKAALFGDFLSFALEDDH
jgi:hypothetical protein